MVYSNLSRVFLILWFNQVPNASLTLDEWQKPVLIRKHHFASSVKIMAIKIFDVPKICEQFSLNLFN